MELMINCALNSLVFNEPGVPQWVLGSINISVMIFELLQT